MQQQQLVLIHFPARRQKSRAVVGHAFDRAINRAVSSRSRLPRVVLVVCDGLRGIARELNFRGARRDTR